MTHQELPEASAPGPGSAQGLSTVPLLLTSPSEAFRRLAADPKWLGPFLLFVVIIVASTWIRMEQDIRFQADAAVGVMERMGLPEEDIDEALASIPDPNEMGTGAVFLHVGQAALGVSVFGFLGALVLWVVAKVFGTQPKYREALTVYWTANLAAAAGYLVLAIMTRLADTVEVSMLGGLIGLEWGSVPQLLLDLLNPFALFTLALLGIGSRYVFRTTSSNGWTIGGTYWALSSLLSFAMQLFGSWASGGL